MKLAILCSFLFSTLFASKAFALPEIFIYCQGVNKVKPNKKKGECLNKKCDFKIRGGGFGDSYHLSYEGDQSKKHIVMVMPEDKKITFRQWPDSKSLLVVDTLCQDNLKKIKKEILEQIPFWKKNKVEKIYFTAQKGQADETFKMYAAIKDPCAEFVNKKIGSFQNFYIRQKWEETSCEKPFGQKKLKLR